MCVKNFRLSRTDILFRIVTQHFDLLLGFSIMSRTRL